MIGRCEWCKHSSHGGDLSAPSEKWYWMTCNHKRRMTPRDSICEHYKIKGGDNERNAQVS